MKVTPQITGIQSTPLGDYAFSNHGELYLLSGKYLIPVQLAPSEPAKKEKKNAE